MTLKKFQDKKVVSRNLVQPKNSIRKINPQTKVACCSYKRILLVELFIYHWVTHDSRMMAIKVMLFHLSKQNKIQPLERSFKFYYIRFLLFSVVAKGILRRSELFLPSIKSSCYNN